MKKYIYLSIMTLALSKPLMAMEGETSDAGHTPAVTSSKPPIVGHSLTISPPDLTDWDGVSNLPARNGEDKIGEFERVTTKRPAPANQIWVPVKAYILRKATHHTDHPYQYVFVTKTYMETPKKERDKSHKVTIGMKNLSEKRINLRKVRFQGEGTNDLIKRYNKDKRGGGKIRSSRFDLSKERLDELLKTPNTFSADATILISE